MRRGSPLSRPGEILRALSRLDVLLLCVVSTVNLNLLPAAAANGPGVFVVWVFVVLLFVIPQGVAVTEITRNPAGGDGIARWIGHHLGSHAGFLSAWCYWVSTIARN